MKKITSALKEKHAWSIRETLGKLSVNGHGEQSLNTGVWEVQSEGIDVCLSCHVVLLLTESQHRDRYRETYAQ